MLSRLASFDAARQDFPAVKQLTAERVAGAGTSRAHCNQEGG